MKQKFLVRQDLEGRKWELHEESIKDKEYFQQLNHNVRENKVAMRQIPKDI